jgi:accessory gene regulator protein AgrB
MKSNSLAAGLGILGVIFIVVGILYALGVLQILTSGPGNHYKHAILCGVLAVASFVAANFARVRTV